jgi:DNA-binding Lrp family transcriptional regulator
LKAFVLINAEAGRSPQIVSLLRKIAGVKMAHTCWARPDIFVVLEVPNEGALSETVLKKIQVIDGIESTAV